MGLLRDNLDGNQCLIQSEQALSLRIPQKARIRLDFHRLHGTKCVSRQFCKMADELSENQIADLKEVFLMFDTHQSGSIDTKDIETMLCGFGISLEKEELDARLSMMASRKCITFPEFLTLLSPNINEDRTAEAHEVF